MVTKEQCILNRVLSSVGYNGSGRLIQAVSSAYNQGKQYASDGVYPNDERGLDTALQGFSPSFIVFSLLDEDSQYDTRDPFFVIENGIRSLDSYDFMRMLKPEDTNRILTREVLDELDDSDFFYAFDDFLEENYPQIYESMDTDNLYEMGYKSGYQIMNVDWNQLAKELSQYKPTMDEGRVLEMTEEELGEIVREGTMKVYEEIKIKEKNKGKFNATKKRTGKSTEELAHSKNPLTRKRAQFALNAKKFNHSK